MKETENLLEHGAIQAWSQLEPQRIEPASLEAGKSGKTSAVYRLGAVESGRSAISSRLVEKARISQTLRKIVNRLVPDPGLQEDLMQEGHRRIDQAGSGVPVLVVATGETQQIAAETRRVLGM